MSASEVKKILHSLNSSSNLAFSFASKTSTEKLKLSVEDVGEIKFPVNKTTIKKLIKQAEKAKFGLKDKTLYDPQVRNTWEINKSRVKIDMRKWKSELKNILDQISQSLFPEGTELVAELHNMLVYEPGQFFKKHQDSEKNDSMQASLVVMLPTKEELKGGNLSIEHNNSKKVYGKNADGNTIQYIAFYADCIHQVSKVISGHRLALTFNISIASRSIARVPSPPELVEEVKKHMSSPLEERGQQLREKSFLCVLAHQYTPKSLSWQGLKGNDIIPALALKSAAEQLGLEVYIGNFEHKITYDVINMYGHYGYSRRHRYLYHENDDATSEYQTGDVINEEWSWISCIGSTGKRIQDPNCDLYNATLIELGSLKQLEVADEEYEEYMGNAGNTLDRLYHRAGILIRDPKAKAFKDIVADPRAELNRITKLKDENTAKEEIEPYLPYVDFFPAEKKIIEKILNIGVKFKSPELIRKLISKKHYRLLFSLPAKCFIGLDKDNKKVVLELMRQYIDSGSYGCREQIMTLLNTCVTEPAICGSFSHFLPSFIKQVTTGVTDTYCFDREKYAEQIKDAAIVFKFALFSNCLKQSLPLLNYIKQRPAAYPIELFVLEFPPSQQSLDIKQMKLFYRGCRKELSDFIKAAIKQDMGSASIPIDDPSIVDKHPQRGYGMAALLEKCKALLSFLASEELHIKLPLYKKDQHGFTHFIAYYGLPLKYSFGSVSSRYYVECSKDLKISKAIREKRLKASLEALALLERV